MISVGDFRWWFPLVTPVGDFRWLSLVTSVGDICSSRLMSGLPVRCLVLPSGVWSSRLVSGPFVWCLVLPSGVRPDVWRLVIDPNSEYIISTYC